MNNLIDFNKTKKAFIIAEAGSNWKCGTYDEDLRQAKELIKIASKSGADAVKFQTYKSETIYVPNAGSAKYLDELGITENINEIFQHLSMPYEMISELSKFCKNENLIFMSTPFSVEDAKHVDPYVTIHKVSSFEINHIRLLEFLAKTKKPILISTGASTFHDIDFAINLLKKKDNKNIVLLQCTSKYPCPIESLNLAVIPKMRQKYNLPIGLSDHSMDPILAPVVAVSLGATVIEKHFTLDRSLPGPDHPFALIPDELEKMVKCIRNAEKSLQSDKKEILPVEKELFQFAKRSIQAIKNISKNEVLQEGVNIDILRPGNRIRGLDARFLFDVEGKKAKNDIKKGDGITEYY